MASADADMRIHEEEESLRPGRRQPPPSPCLIQYYQATEVMPEENVLLHDLMQKQPAVLGSLQVVSGVMSVGVGLVFAVTQDMQQSFLTLFRVSHLTGALVSFVLNCGCIIVGVIGAILISVDVALWTTDNEPFMRMEVLQLCVLGLEVFLSAVLCFWFVKEKPPKSTERST